MSFKNKKYKRVIGFLVAKGLLHNNHVEPQTEHKLDVKEAVWVAEHLEPRVWEVLPAVIIRFRGSCINHEALPEELQDLIPLFIRGEIPGGSYLGIEFRDMARWTNVELADGRTKPLQERKRLKSFRLSPRVIEVLKMRSKEKGVSETAFLEDLILD